MLRRYSLVANVHAPSPATLPSHRPAEFDNLLDEFLEVHGQSTSAREVRSLLAMCWAVLSRCTQCRRPELSLTPGAPLAVPFAGQCAVPLPQGQPGACGMLTGGPEAHSFRSWPQSSIFPSHVMSSVASLCATGIPHPAFGTLMLATPQVGQEMEFHGFDDADAAVAVEKVRNICQPCAPARMHSTRLAPRVPPMLLPLPSPLQTATLALQPAAPLTHAALPTPSVQAREAVRQAEQEELNGEGEAGGHAGRREERVPQYLQPQERERWDCESILR